MITLRKTVLQKIVVQDDEITLGHGDTPHAALRDAHSRLNPVHAKLASQLEQINDLAGYSNTLLAKEVLPL